MTKLYLAGPWFNADQKERATTARALLANNPTVDLVHFPFDFQYKDATIDDPKGVFGSLEWQDATYQNDLSAMGTATAGVFLYDLDNVDDGTAMELGFMRAMHKPCIVVLFNKSNAKVNLMVANGGTAFIDGETDFNQLATYDFEHFPSQKVCPYEVF